MTRRIGLILLLQNLALLAMIAVKQWTLSTGAEVLLETQPIDPRSLFQGDYVSLNYSISRLLPEKLEGDDLFAVHDPIHVVLRLEGKYWRAISLHKRRPAVSEGQWALRGEIESIQDGFWNPETRQQEAGKVLQVRYGIENYFVPEGEGRALERPQAGEKVDILVAIDRFGSAGIKGVLVNGEMRYREQLF